MNKDTLKISGMTCAACAARIEKVVGKMEGVDMISVNLATEKGAGFLRPGTNRSGEYQRKNRESGIRAPAEIIEKKLVDEDKLRKEKEIRTLWD